MWGDALQYKCPHEYFCVISKNVSTLNTQSLDMMAIATELCTMDASIFVAQETNMAWTLLLSKHWRPNATQSTVI